MPRIAARPVQLELPFPALGGIRPSWRSLVLIAAAFEGRDSLEYLLEYGVPETTVKTAPLRPITVEDPITDDDIPF